MRRMPATVIATASGRRSGLFAVDDRVDRAADQIRDQDRHSHRRPGKRQRAPQLAAIRAQKARQTAIGPHQSTIQSEVTADAWGLLEAFRLGAGDFPASARFRAGAAGPRQDLEVGDVVVGRRLAVVLGEGDHQPVEAGSEVVVVDLRPGRGRVAAGRPDLRGEQAVRAPNSGGSRTMRRPGGRGRSGFPQRSSASPGRRSRGRG